MLDHFNSDKQIQFSSRHVFILPHFVSAEQPGVDREQARRCQRSDIRPEEVSGLIVDCHTNTNK